MIERDIQANHQFVAYEVDCGVELAFLVVDAVSKYLLILGKIQILTSFSSHSRLRMTMFVGFFQVGRIFAIFHLTKPQNVHRINAKKCQL